MRIGSLRTVASGLIGIKSDSLSRADTEWIARPADIYTLEGGASVCHANFHLLADNVGIPTMAEQLGATGS